MDRIWTKNYQTGVPKTIDAKEYTSMMDSFSQYTKKFADYPAFSNFGVKLSYRDLNRLSAKVAAYLQSLGLKRGDRVALMMPNILQYPVALFGVLRAGMVVVNVNPLYTKRELQYQLKDSGAVAIVVGANFAHTLQLALPDTDIKHVVVTELGDMLGTVKGGVFNFVVKHVKKMVPKFNIPQAVTFKNMLQRGAKQKLVDIDIQPEDIAFLQYTGGTTGPSKGAVLTHANIVANATQFRAWVSLNVIPGEDVVVTPLPMYHIFSLLVCCISFIGLGAECLLITNPRDINMFVKILKKTRCHFFVGINTLYNALMNHPDFDKIDFSSYKLSASGGMATQQVVADRWHSITGTHIMQGYGLTETSPVITINPLDLGCFNGSAGLPLPNTDISIRDEAGHELPQGSEGEVCVKGPQVMPGYWNKPEETAKVFDDEGWLYTGDIGYVDEDGFLYIVDRKKDMIIVSGFNVYPNEIEEVLMQHEGVCEVAVIGVPSERTGEAVKAFVVKKDLNLTDEDLMKFCRKNLTAYKVPKIYEYRDDLPKSNVGKVLRRELRDEA